VHYGLLAELLLLALGEVEQVIVGGALVGVAEDVVGRRSA
jgi:hypothetical protein